MTVGFHRIDGVLCVDGLALDAIADGFGTPLFVYSAERIRHNYHRFCRAVGVERVGAQVNFAVKANSNLAVLRILALLGSETPGAGADIVSIGEMQRALAAGFPREQIVFSGVGKSDAEITAALTAGIGQINAESESEVERILALAEGIPNSCRLALRLNPDVTANTHAKISTGNKGAKFGIPSAAIPDLYAKIADRCSSLGGMAMGGLAVHIGSQIMELSSFETAWGELLDVAESLRKQGLSVPSLDLGGGFGITSDNAADIHGIGALINRLFADKAYHLSLEPGRFLLADAGVLLTRVLHQKDTSGKTTSGKKFIITDGAMNDLIRPTLYDAWHDIEAVKSPLVAGTQVAGTQVAGTQVAGTQVAGTQVSDIVGPICETGDYLGLGRRLPQVARGDVLAVLHAGAYGAVMRSNYNTRPFASEVMVIDGKVYRVSVTQTVDDLLAQDIIPDILG